MLKYLVCALAAFLVSLVDKDNLDVCRVREDAWQNWKFGSPKNFLAFYDACVCMQQAVLWNEE